MNKAPRIIRDIARDAMAALNCLIIERAKVIRLEADKAELQAPLDKANSEIDRLSKLAESCGAFDVMDLDE